MKSFMRVQVPGLSITMDCDEIDVENLLKAALPIFVAARERISKEKPEEIE